MCCALISIIYRQQCAGIVTIKSASFTTNTQNIRNNATTTPPTSTQPISTTTNQCNASPRKRRNQNVKYLAQILTPIAHFLRTNFKLVGKYSILAKVFHPSKSCVNVGQQNAYSYRKTQFQQLKRTICSKTQGYLQQNAMLTPTKCKANSSKTQGKMQQNAR